MPDIFDQIAQERKSSSQKKELDIFDQIARERKVPTNLGVRAAKEFGSYALGTYGDISRLVGLGKNELPGTEARIQREARATPEELIYHVEDDVIPSSSKLPTSQELLQAMGGVSEAEDPIERIVSRASKAAGGGLSLGGPIAVLPSTIGGAVNQSSQELGASPLVGTVLEIGSNIGTGIAQSLKKATQKTSGLTPRQFENLKKPKNVTPERFEKIVNAVETESKNIADNILNTNKTRVAMNEFPDFRQRVEKGFDKVRDLAKQIPHKFEGTDLVRQYHKQARERISKGFPEAAAQRAYEKEMQYLIKKHAGKDYTTDALVDVYRDNNKALSGMFDKTVSSNINEAKKSAILDFQDMIRNQFEKVLPETEFSNLFKFTNKIYSDSMKIGQIENYLEKLFSGGKVNFKEAHKYFDKNKIQDAIKSVYGKESANAFTNLQKDFLSYENGLKFIKAAESKNINLKDYGWLLFPPVGAVKIGKKKLSQAVDFLLDKPQVMVKWDDALKDIKKGSYQIGARKLKEVSDEIEKSSQQSLQGRTEKTTEKR